MTPPQILLTNDDGFQSPGLWAAAEALSAIGFVQVVAPRDQSTGAGRSLPGNSDGTIEPREIPINGTMWTTYAVGGSPAQAVLHGVLEVLPARPDLVVSGINYGENIGTGVTISGTIGAALEGAALGIPALAVSLETEKQHHLSYSKEVDFSTAAHFTRLFAKLLLEHHMPDDIDVLKVDVPASGTPETPWKITRLSRQRYFHAMTPKRKSWTESTKIDYQPDENLAEFPPDSDVYTVKVKKWVSVTPLSLDLTSRIDLNDLKQFIREQI